MKKWLGRVFRLSQMLRMHHIFDITNLKGYSYYTRGYSPQLDCGACGYGALEFKIFIRQVDCFLVKTYVEQ